MLLVTSYWEDYKKQPTAAEDMQTDTELPTTTFELEPHNFGGDDKEENTVLSIETKEEEGPKETKEDEKVSETSSENNTKMDLD